MQWRVSALLHAVLQPVFGDAGTCQRLPLSHLTKRSLCACCLCFDALFTPHTQEAAKANADQVRAAFQVVLTAKVEVYNRTAQKMLLLGISSLIKVPKAAVPPFLRFIAFWPSSPFPLCCLTR
jgi:hypothetical protein